MSKIEAKTRISYAYIPYIITLLLSWMFFVSITVSVGGANHEATTDEQITYMQVFVNIVDSLNAVSLTLLLLPLTALIVCKIRRKIATRHALAHLPILFIFVLLVVMQQNIMLRLISNFGS